MYSRIYSLFVLAAEVTTEAGQAVGTSPPARQLAPGCGGPNMVPNVLVPLIIVFVIMYIFIVSPQRKRDKRRREMLDSVAKGDDVVTIGGIRGTVWQVKEDEVVVKVSDDVKMTFSRGAIARVGKEEAGSTK